MRILALFALVALAEAPNPEAPVPMAARDPGVVRLAPDAENRWVPFTLTPATRSASP